MGLLRALVRRAPSAQGVADTFLSSVGGGALGAGLGAATSDNGDGLVPGMLLGAGAGLGARGLTPMAIRAIKRALGGVSDAELDKLLSRFISDRMED